MVCNGLKRNASPAGVAVVAGLLVLFTSAAIRVDAQDVTDGPTRLLLDCDGGYWEALQGKGRLDVVHDRTHVRQGLGSLRISPPEKGRYWGLSLRRVDARDAVALEAALFHAGKKRAWVTVFIQDGGAARGDDRLIERVYMNPGWNELRVTLADAKVKSGERTLDLSKPLFRVSIERGGPKDAFFVDNVRLALAPVPKPRKIIARYRRLLRDKDPESAARAPALLDRLPEAKRFPLLLKALRPEQPAVIRRAIVRALRRCGTDAAAKAVSRKRGRRNDALGLQLVDLMGQMVAPAGRVAALRLASDAKETAGVRAVALRSAARSGRGDIVSLAARIPADAAWPLAAARAIALDRAGTPGAVDALITMLETIGHPRVRLDVHEALVRLTAMDFGYEVVQWKGWWAKNRTSVLGRGKVGRAGGYARFYGLPVRGAALVFVLDVSGSMRDPISSKRAREHIASAKHLRGVKLETRLDLAKAELAHTLRQLPPETRFNVGFFNDEVFWLHRELVAAKAKEVEDTVKRVQRMSAGQKTNVHGALAQSLEAAWSRGQTGLTTGPDTIFLLSDGAPSAGKITRFIPLADDIRERNLARFVRINTILVGNRGQRFLRRLAHESGGRFVNVGG